MGKQHYDFDSLIKKNNQIFAMHLWFNVVLNLALLILLGLQLEVLTYSTLS